MILFDYIQSFNLVPIQISAHVITKITPIFKDLKILRSIIDINNPKFGNFFKNFNTST